MSVKIAIIDSGVNPDHFHVQGIEKGLSFYSDDKKIYCKQIILQSHVVYAKVFFIIMLLLDFDHIISTVILMQKEHF